MDQNLDKHIKLLIERYPDLDLCSKDISAAYKIMEQCYINCGKLLIAGNGGSAADSEHIVGELMKSFKMPRTLPDDLVNNLKEQDAVLGDMICKNLQGALPAIALDGHLALTTAFINDCDPLLCFAQQVNGLGKPEDVFLGISTSGNSKNVVYAAMVAKAKGMKVIALTGSKESKLSVIADVCVRVPRTETYMIQELHLPVYHCWCLMLEEKFFGNNY